MLIFAESIQATELCLVIQVLATVLSWLEQPKDVFACARASKHLQGIAAYAPLRLHICQAESTARPKHVEDVTLVRQTLQGVCRHFKGVRMPLLSMLVLFKLPRQLIKSQCCCCRCPFARFK